MIKDGMIVGERYEIVSKVGAGGMADVYKAKDHKLNRFVAMKVLGRHKFYQEIQDRSPVRSRPDPSQCSQCF